MNREDAIQALAAAIREERELDRRLIEEGLPRSGTVRLSPDARIAEGLIRHLPAYGLSVRDDAGEELS